MIFHHIILKIANVGYKFAQCEFQRYCICSRAKVKALGKRQISQKFVFFRAKLMISFESRVLKVPTIAASDISDMLVSSASDTTLSTPLTKSIEPHGFSSAEKPKCVKWSIEGYRATAVQPCFRTKYNKTAPRCPSIRFWVVQYRSYRDHSHRRVMVDRNSQMSRSKRFVNC